VRGRVVLRALRGPGFRSSPFYELSVGWFSSFYQGSDVESQQRASLELQLRACEPHGLPFGISSFDLKPCSKHVGDGKFGSFECSIVARPRGTWLLAGHQVSEVQGVFRIVAICRFGVDFKGESHCIALVFSGDRVESSGPPITTTGDLLGRLGCCCLSF
jgi:hypothetical protein